MRLKKGFITIIIATLFLQLFSGIQIAKAEENSEYINGDSIETETLDNGLELEVVEKTEDTVVVETEHIAGETEVFVEIDMDRETENINVSGEVINEEGQLVSQNYDVVVHDVEGDNFVATFIDIETEDIIDIDTTEMSASALPIVIVAAVARYGIKYAIKKYGKKAAKYAVSSRSYGKVLSSVSKLSANKRKHILASKHNWSKVTGNNWSDVSKVMSHVMRYGKESAYKSVRKKTLKMSGRTVTVTFKRANGKIYISNGWVK
ncbi:SAR2788 family putative toxin [Virgibacillus chiguensis]|uniref:Toxin 35 n=1 Tax=Virgibacillus chiguensis TaxID=411959 RepID=A0A1M5V5W1_9BACI|nr:SAR2788 family putative toxin [Virgibacillus chiguensis]SHH70566.1 toxin 35 [Virgibacillus chiguensis]